MKPETVAVEATESLDVHYLGRVAYDDALELQRALVDEIYHGERGHTLLFVEHDPVITLGSAASSADVLCSRDALLERGVDVRPTDRGGAATYHGPGQLVGYPLIDLRCFDRDLGAYLRSLEEALVETVAHFGVDAWSPADETGVWCAEGKLAAIGVRATRWVTSHGFALNVAPDLEHFQLLVPCGVPGAAVTSLQALGTDAGMETVAERFVTEWSQRWRLTPTASSVTPRETTPTRENRQR